MKTNLPAALVLVSAAMLASCATTPSGEAPPAPWAAASPSAPKKLYSAQERTWLTACVGMTDTAWTAAREKRRGVPKETVRARYAGTAKPELALATVDKVYKDEFQHPWDYAVHFFKECAAELAHVPGERAEAGAYCMQNVMIASVALERKKSGANKEQAYRAFEQFKSETPKRVVDRVYAGSGERGATMMGEWSSCINPLSE